MAARNYPLAGNAIFHSDAAATTRLQQFAKTLKKYSPRQSVGPPGSATTCHGRIVLRRSEETSEMQPHSVSHP